MRRRHNFRLFQQPLRLLAREIRNSNRLRFSLLKGLLHGFPCVDVVSVTVDDFAVGVFGEHILTPAESDGPVHEVKVDVVSVEVFEGGIEGGLDVVWMVAVVPKDIVRDPE